MNNVRDLETDRRAGKRTLAVRLGRERTRLLYAAMLAVAFLVAPLPWALGSLSAWLLLRGWRSRWPCGSSASCARVSTAPR